MHNRYKLREVVLTDMNVNTTLMIFAVVAALGLMTALMVLQPNLPQALAQGQGFHKFKACDTPARGHVSFNAHCD